MMILRCLADRLAGTAKNGNAPTAKSGWDLDAS